MAYEERLESLELIAQLIRELPARASAEPRARDNSSASRDDAAEADTSEALDHLLDAMLDHHMLDDHDTLVELLRASFEQGSALARVSAICERGLVSRETPAGRWFWNRIKFEVLELAQSELPDEVDILNEQLSALGWCAETVDTDSPGASRMLDWISQQAVRVLLKIGELARRVSQTPDDWLGSVLTVCDDLVAVGRYSEAVEVLRLSATTMAICGPSSSASLSPGHPSKFRDDVPYLLEMLEGGRPRHDDAWERQ